RRDHAPSPPALPPLSLHDALPISGQAGRELVGEALAAGAQGVVLKEAPLSELVEAVRVAAAGGIYVDRSLAGALVPGEGAPADRSEEHTSELQSRSDLVCRPLLEK